MWIYTLSDCKRSKIRQWIYMLEGWSISNCMVYWWNQSTIVTCESGRERFPTQWEIQKIVLWYGSRWLLMCLIPSECGRCLQAGARSRLRRSGGDLGRLHWPHLWDAQTGKHWGRSRCQGIVSVDHISMMAFSLFSFEAFYRLILFCYISVCIFVKLNEL